MAAHWYRPNHAILLYWSRPRQGRDRGNLDVALRTQVGDVTDPPSGSAPWDSIATRLMSAEMPGVICSACATGNRAEARFCRECGAALARACPACGAAVGAEQRFCDVCGHNLSGAAQEPSQPRAVAVERIAERRLVSVLFADLVGFTALSESRDAEEVRELLSRFFDTCRRLVERIGGTVEKFIGDAVMAVWGTPTANEDDAERAVRTGLDLVAAIQGLTDELGADVKVRVGVLTGEAAVTVGASRRDRRAPSGVAGRPGTGWPARTARGTG